MYFSKKLVGNSRTAVAQYNDVKETRDMQTKHARKQCEDAGISVNKGLIPRDVYQEFDNTTVTVMHSDDGDTYLNDLMPLSTSVSIGKLTHRFRQASDAGRIQVSMTGQIGVKMDQVEYKFGGTIVPITDGGFDRNWREWNAQSSEGFDALIDDQRETVRALRGNLADQFLDGHVDKDGNTIVVDGLSWAGMRNDATVAQISLVFDFTDVSKTGDEIKAAFIDEIRNIMWITNLCQQDLTYYVSREIASNFERKFSTQYDARIIMQELADLMGVAAIKVSSKLTDNELMGFPLDSNRIKPIVGMGVNTVAMPRPLYNSNYEFVTWAAIGFEVRPDYNGNTCAVYGS